MKNYLYQAILILVLFLLQVAAIGVFPGASVWFPQLVLLYVIAYALNHAFVQTLWLSFGAGLLSELFSTVSFGSSTAAFFITGILIYVVTRRLTSRDVSLKTLIFLIVPATLLFPIWVYAYSGVLALFQISEGIGFADFYTITILWTAFSNLIFFFPVNFLISLLDRR